MKHVIGRLRGLVMGDGSINATLTEMDVREGPRPKTAAAFGASQDVLAAVNLRKPGTEFETLARPGAGVALVVPNIKVFLQDEKDNFLEKVEARWGTLDGLALLGPIRDLDAPGDFWRQDVCAGIVEDTNLMSEAYREMIEIGLYRDDGWARLVLPEKLAEYQEVVDRELSAEWSRLAPGFPMKHEVRVTSRPGSYDTINSLSCILSTEPQNGSVEIILPAEVRLGGFGWRVRDTEHHNDRPLNRTPVLACKRSINRPAFNIGHGYGRPHLQLILGPNGFDRRAFPTELNEDFADKYANGKTMSVLRALGWAK